MAMLVGLVIGWCDPAADPDRGRRRRRPRRSPATVFRSDVRFFGAGVIGVAAIWTLLKILGPIVGGISSAHGRLASARAGGEVLPLVERDIPIGIVGAASSSRSLVPIAVLLWLFIAGGPLAGRRGAADRAAPCSSCWSPAS